MALTPSSTALAFRVSKFPVRPFSSAPTMAMAPTQKTREAVTKPSATEFPPAFRMWESLSCTHWPRRPIRASRSSSSPRMEPATMERMATRVFCPLRLPVTPT